MCSVSVENRAVCNLLVCFDVEPDTWITRRGSHDLFRVFALHSAPMHAPHRHTADRHVHAHDLPHPRHCDDCFKSKSIMLAESRIY